MENIRALIVDDSSVMRKIVERSLRQAAWHIGSDRGSKRSGSPRGGTEP